MSGGLKINEEKKPKNKNDNCGTDYTYLQKILSHARYLTTKSLLLFKATMLDLIHHPKTVQT